MKERDSEGGKMRVTRRGSHTQTREMERVKRRRGGRGWRKESYTCTTFEINTNRQDRERETETDSDRDKVRERRERKTDTE
jgi:hypothetical protein